MQSSKLRNQRYFKLAEAYGTTSSHLQIKEANFSRHKWVPVLPLCLGHTLEHTVKQRPHLLWSVNKTILHIRHSIVCTATANKITVKLSFMHNVLACEKWHTEWENVHQLSFCFQSSSCIIALMSDNLSITYCIFKYGLCVLRDKSGKHAVLAVQCERDSGSVMSIGHRHGSWRCTQTQSMCSWLPAYWLMNS